MGARSKRFGKLDSRDSRDTRLPRWGRDQNRNGLRDHAPLPIPDCPDGGEIKTLPRAQCPRPPGYQTAPMGARSKHNALLHMTTITDTRLPRWGRDQNSRERYTRNRCGIPDCPDGGEIKTHRAIRHIRSLRYQTAPMGARSKRPHRQGQRHHRDTRLPRWGRDQNTVETGAIWSQLIPDCPDGGEIKTIFFSAAPRKNRYQTAPMGARSKPCFSFCWRNESDTRLPRWGRDQNTLE